MPITSHMLVLLASAALGMSAVTPTLAQNDASDRPLAGAPKG